MTQSILQHMHPTFRPGPGRFRRVRVYLDSLRATGPDLLHERARPAVRGRHHQTLGELDRRESRQATWLA